MKREQARKQRMTLIQPPRRGTRPTLKLLLIQRYYSTVHSHKKYLIIITSIFLLRLKLLLVPEEAASSGVRPSAAAAAAAAAAVGLADSDFVPYFQRVSISGDDNTGVSIFFSENLITLIGGIQGQGRGKLA